MCLPDPLTTDEASEAGAIINPPGSGAYEPPERLASLTKPNNQIIIKINNIITNKQTNKHIKS